MSYDARCACRLTPPNKILATALLPNGVSWATGRGPRLTKSSMHDDKVVSKLNLKQETFVKIKKKTSKKNIFAI